MPQFTRPTIVAAVRTVDRWYQAAVDSFLLEHGLEHAAPEGSVQMRANLLIRHLLGNPDATTDDGGNLVDVVVRDLVERAVSAPLLHSEIASGQSGFAERVPKLARALALDGFVVEDGRLRRALPAAINLPAADDEVHELLKRLNFAVPAGHLDQAIQSHTDGHWASANSQLRSFMEGLLDEIAERLSTDPSTVPPPGHPRRTWLATTVSPPFLLASLNEWDGQGKGYIEGFFRRLHPQGSHPGLSDESDSTFRLHTVLIVARLFLWRLAERLGA